MYHFQYEKEKKNLNYPKSASMGFFLRGLKNEDETVVIIEPLVSEPLKFYCIFFTNYFEIPVV